MITISLESNFESFNCNATIHYLIECITFYKEDYIVIIILLLWNNCGYISFIRNITKFIHSCGCRSPPNQFEPKKSN